jgi:hypothetical protein
VLREEVAVDDAAAGDEPAAKEVVALVADEGDLDEGDVQPDVEALGASSSFSGPGRPGNDLR